jgi:hypothetical protein
MAKRPPLDERLRARLNADAEELKRQLDHPEFQKQQERWRRFTDRPEFRKMQEQARRFKEVFNKPSSPPTSQKPRRKRAPGGGRKREFSGDDETRLRGLYREHRKQFPDVTDEAAVAYLKPFLPADKRDAHLSTFVRRIFEPVRGKRSKQNKQAK